MSKRTGTKGRRKPKKAPARTRQARVASKRPKGKRVASKAKRKRKVSPARLRAAKARLARRVKHKEMWPKRHRSPSGYWKWENGKWVDIVRSAVPALRRVTS